MPAKLDLTGQQYGKLTVIKESEQRKNNLVTWICQCECGKEVLATARGLRNGSIKSCGCSRLKDIKGQKFGKLTAIKPTTERRHGSVVWECQCDCGNPFPVYATVEGLRVGDNTSCGCYNKAREQFAKKYRIDLTGNKYYRLTVLEPTEHRTEHLNVIWKCQCDCGNICYVSTNHLQSGNTKSCGCLAGDSIGEQKIATILEENQVHFKAQYIFSKLPNRKYDFAILDENDTPIQLIEFDGEQHYIEAPFFKKTLQEQKEIDKIKDQFAREQRIPLARVPYWEREKLNFELLLQYLEKSKKELYNYDKCNEKVT